ncbi:MAG: RsbRD N-terminal domain-containing protein [Deltaproteobacteria bacterium]|nr:RsbRD N-terminal domain-containing protein [Deltaproteobacteria bacterium]
MIEVLLADKRRKSRILDTWFEDILKSYPDQTAKIFKTKKNRFANPVGVILSEEIGAIYDGLIEGAEIQELSRFLDNIIRVRAVQDFTASNAVRFVFLLKGILRGELAAEINSGQVSAQELFELETRIDGVALLAFDIYMRCREKLYDLRANELKNRTFRLLQRANLIVDLELKKEAETDAEQD